MENLPDNPITFFVECYKEIELHFPDFSPDVKAEMAVRFEKSFTNDENHGMTKSEFQLRCRQLARRLKAIEDWGVSGDEENR